MAGDIPHGSIPKNTTLPADLYTFEVEEMDDTTSSTGKRMLSLAARVAEGDFEGTPYWENYVVGTDKDPEATQEKTWKRMPAVQFRRLVEAIQVPKIANSAQQCQAMVGTRFSAFLDEYEDTREGQYQGEMRNRIKRYYKVGEAPQGNGPVVQAASPMLAQTQTAAPAGIPQQTSGGKVQCGSCGQPVIRALLARHQMEECPSLQHASKMQQQTESQK